MSVTTSDPIADMLTRIRNALAVRRATIEMPHSQFKEAVATLLKDNHYIVGVAVEDDAIGKRLTLNLFGENENSNLTEIKRLSKPGRRQYSSADKIPRVKQGRGIVIVSTSKGLMTGDEAKKQHLGGELICEVY
jgi:small subunit ribosomal protein S8